MQKIVVIGYGEMGAWHVRHVNESSVAKIMGIFDTGSERKNLAINNGLYVFSSFEDVLNSDADICIVATPNDAHLNQVIDCLDAKKHVIVEKPMALNYDEAFLMYEAAQKNDRLLCVHQNRRWDADYIAIMQVLQSGKLGEVFNIESRIHGSRGIPSNWRRQKEYGGGMLYDWGVHLIDQMITFYPDVEVASVQCEFCHYTEKEVDDGFFLTIHLKNGIRMFVEVNTCNFIALPRFYISASKGSAVIDDWRNPCRIVECKAWKEEDVIPLECGTAITRTMAPRDEITTDVYDWEYPSIEKFVFIDNFCNAVEGKEELIVKKEQVLKVLKIIDAANKSAENNGALIEIDN